MAIATSARNSRAGSTPRTTTQSRNAQTNSAAQVANSKQRPQTTVSRNAVVVDPQTGNKQLVRNRQVTQNRGQVYQNGRLVADYGIGGEAARKAQSFAASIGTSPYLRGKTSVTIGRQESSYTPKWIS